MPALESRKKSDPRVASASELIAEVLRKVRRVTLD